MSACRYWLLIWPHIVILLAGLIAVVFIEWTFAPYNSGARGLLADNLYAIGCMILWVVFGRSGLIFLNHCGNWPWRRQCAKDQGCRE